MGSHSRNDIKNIQLKLVAITLFEIAVYYFDNSMITQTIFEGISLHK